MTIQTQNKIDKKQKLIKKLAVALQKNIQRRKNVHKSLEQSDAQGFIETKPLSCRAEG